MIFKALLRSVLLIAVATGLFACSNGGDGNSTDVNSSAQEQVTSFSSDVLLLDDSFQVVEVVSDSDNDGASVLTIAYDQLDAESIKDKIIIIPATEDQLEDTYVKVTDVTFTDNQSESGKNIAKVNFVTPMIDEILGKIDFVLPDDALETAEVTHKFFPSTFTQNIQSNAASRSDVASNDESESAANGSYEWTLFPSFDLDLFKMQIIENTKDKKVLNFNLLDLPVFEYGVPGEDPKGTGNLSGDMKITIKDIESSFDRKSLNTDLNERVSFDVTTERELKFALKGELLVNLQSLFNDDNRATFQCGVAKVVTDEVIGTSYEIKGAKWRDSICLGGARLKIASVFVTPLLGNEDILGNDQSKKEIPIYFDFFLTLDASLKLSAEGSLTISRTDRVVHGMSLQDGVLSTWNRSYDPGSGLSAEQLTEIDVSQENPYDWTLHLFDAKGEAQIHAGAAAGLKIAGVYPFVAEAWRGVKGEADFKITPIGGDGKVCVSASLSPDVGARVSVGLSLTASEKVIVEEGKDYDNEKWSTGASFSYGWEFFTDVDPLEYESCENDDYKVNLDVDTSDSTQVSISAPTVTDKSGETSYTVDNYHMVVYNSLGLIVGSFADTGGLLSLGDLSPGGYEAVVIVKLVDGDKDIVFEETVPYTVSYLPQSVSVAPSDGSAEVSWQSIAGVSYNICISRTISEYSCSAQTVSSADMQVMTAVTSSIVVPNLQNDTTYYIAVAAEKNGVFEDSSVKSVTPSGLLAVPDAPTNVTAEFTNTDPLTLSFDWDGDADSGYVVCYGTTDLSNFEEGDIDICDGFENTTRALVDGNTFTVPEVVDANTTYYFRVAENTYGTTGLVSEPITAIFGSEPTSNEFVVYAVNEQGSELQVPAGASSCDFSATGSWKKDFSSTTSGPDGLFPWSATKLPASNQMSLIVRRSSGEFEYVGSSRRLSVTAGEYLHFLMNDRPDYYSDNSGELNVTWSCSSETVDVLNGLVAHYKFENNANDSSTNSLSGIEYGGIGYTDGVVDERAGNFDGVDDYISAAEVLPFNGASKYSVTGWFNAISGASILESTLDGVGTSRSGGFNIIINPENGWFYVGISSDGVDNRAGVYDDSIDYRDGNWHHFAVTYDGSLANTGIDIYIDNVKKSPKLNTGIYIEDNITLAGSEWSEAIQIGRTDNLTDEFYFEGKIDDLRIYDRVVTSQEVSVLYGHASFELEEDLVAHYEFEGTANDSSPYGNNGTSLGGMTYTNGVIGKAASFDGFDDFITIPDSDSLDLSEAITISAWVKLDQLTGLSANNIIINKDGNFNHGYELAIHDTPSNSSVIPRTNLSLHLGYGLSLPQDNGGWTDGGIAVPEDEWVHIVVSYDGAKVKIYANGQQVKEIATNGNVGISSGDLRIGARGNTGSAPLSLFKGEIDDLRIYSRAVTAAEVTSLFNLRSGLVAHFEFEDNSLDSSGNGNHGLEHGDVTYSDGVTGKAASFNGLNSYIDVAENSLVYNNFTISVWSKTDDTNQRGHLVSRYENTKRSYEVFLPGNEKVRYQINSENNWSYLDKGSRTVGTWNHIVLTYDSGVFSGWLNNQKLFQQVENVEINKDDIPFIIGASRSGTNYFYNGLIDDLRVYDRGLSASEISRLYSLN